MFFSDHVHTHTHIAIICLSVVIRKESTRSKRSGKSHIFPDHPRCITFTKVVMWGGVSVSTKSVQGFWLPEGSKSAIFLCLVLWLIQRVRATAQPVIMSTAGTVFCPCVCVSVYWQKKTPENCWI